MLSPLLPMDFPFPSGCQLCGWKSDPAADRFSRASGKQTLPCQTGEVSVCQDLNGPTAVKWRPTELSQFASLTHCCCRPPLPRPAHPVGPLLPFVAPPGPDATLPHQNYSSRRGSQRRPRRCAVALSAEGAIIWELGSPFWESAAAIASEASMQKGFCVRAEGELLDLFE